MNKIKDAVKTAVKGHAPAPENPNDPKFVKEHGEKGGRIHLKHDPRNLLSQKNKGLGVHIASVGGLSVCTGKGFRVQVCLLDEKKKKCSRYHQTKTCGALGDSSAQVGETIWFRSFESFKGYVYVRVWDHHTMRVNSLFMGQRTIKVDVQSIVAGPANPTNPGGDTTKLLKRLTYTKHGGAKQIKNDPVAKTATIVLQFCFGADTKHENLLGVAPKPVKGNAQAAKPKAGPAPVPSKPAPAPVPNQPAPVPVHVDEQTVDEQAVDEQAVDEQVVDDVEEPTDEPAEHEDDLNGATEDEAGDDVYADAEASDEQP